MLSVPLLAVALTMNEFYEPARLTVQSLADGTRHAKLNIASGQWWNYASIGRLLVRYLLLHITEKRHFDDIALEV